MSSRWSPVRPPQSRPPPHPLSPLSTSLCEHVRVNKQLDVPPNMSYSLFLEYPLLYLAVMLQVISPITSWVSSPQLSFPSVDNAHCEGGCFPLFYHVVSWASLASPSPCEAAAQLMAGDLFM